MAQDLKTLLVSIIGGFTGLVITLLLLTIGFWKTII
ncbi:DUF2273 domain-containing protein [Secundilactobacillus pentosiphilus]|nr:DUF2273 domain-containing protein [Secundilactobacillus pentosiphilus]